MKVLLITVPDLNELFTEEREVNGKIWNLVAFLTSMVSQIQGILCTT